MNNLNPNISLHQSGIIKKIWASWLPKSLTCLPATALGFVLLITSFLPSIILAQNGDLKEDPEAREVFEELDRRREKVTYEKTDMQMTIIDPKGRERVRKMRSFSYDENQINKNLIVFLEPADVRGTAFLTITRDDEELQKLYLPALGRVQVITASQQNNRFMGSDFTYEDLGAQNPDDYTFTLLSETDTMTTLKAIKKGTSQYAYIHFLVDPNRYTLEEARYFDESGEMIKRLEASDYTEVLDEVWRAGTMVMYDLKADRRTRLEWTDRTINESIPEWRFTERALRRGVR